MGAAFLPICLHASVNCEFPAPFYLFVRLAGRKRMGSGDPPGLQSFLSWCAPNGIFRLGRHVISRLGWIWPGTPLNVHRNVHRLQLKYPDDSCAALHIESRVPSAAGPVRIKVEAGTLLSKKHKLV